MRIEVIKCDICKKEHDAQYQLPPQWVTTIHHTLSAEQEERHFCCKDCLIKWTYEKVEKYE